MPFFIGINYNFVGGSKKKNEKNGTQLLDASLHMWG